MSKKKSLLETHPELCKEWDYEKNGDLTPDLVTYGSNKYIWWKCQKNPHHMWETKIHHRAAGSKCLFCTHQKVSLETCLQTINPVLAKRWHPTLNGELTPYDVFPGSNKKVWWVCQKGHISLASITNRNKNRNCPFCSNKKVLKENSAGFLYPQLVKFWDFKKNGGLTPFMFAPKSHKKIWWLCDKGHSFEYSIAYKVKNIESCRYCNGKSFSYEKSLEYLFPEIAKEWHPTLNGVISPKKITSKNAKKVWWLCDKGHEFQAKISNRTANRTKCPYCLNYKTQEIVREFFQNLLGVSFKHSSPPWLLNKKTNRLLRLDGFNEKLGLAFEYDGEFHFKNHPKANKEELLKTKNRDKIKNQLCKENNITLIRIPYTEKNNLENFIENKLKEYSFFKDLL